MVQQTKILVVDDEAVILDSVPKILRAEGFDVSTADTAESALNILRTAAPEVVLVDLKLPKLSGMEFLGIVQKEFPQVAAIMMTGYSTLHNAVAALQNGAFDFLPKPFTFEELLSVVQRAARFVNLSASRRSTGSNGAMTNRHFLGLHTWAKLEADGMAQLGITDLFQATVGLIARIELPAVNGELRQGGLLAQIVAQDEMKHTAWAVLGGRVIEVNRHVQEDSQLLNRDPMDSGWLVRIVPDNIENDLANLGQ
jgi:FixJ family two-component response regulator/glycine cleavage system H lipoate-binding protein